MTTSERRQIKQARQSDDLVVIGMRLTLLRERFGLTQVGFANYTGVHRSTIDSIERGKTASSMAVWIKIAEACDESLDWLLLGKATK